MKSKVHPSYKTKYRVANWPAYNQALVRRGDVTVWLSSEAIAAWTPGRSGRRGGQRRYSDLAIETALTLRLLYHLPLRQAEGFLHALFGMMRLDLSAPDYTTLSRRSQHLRRRLRPVPPGEGLHLVLDSTGLSIVGAGEWAAAKHGGRGRPLTGPDDGQPRAVEHEMEALAGRDQSQTARQMPTEPGERRIVGGGEVEAHHPEQGVQESFGLAQWEMVEEPQGQGGLDGEIRVPPLPAPPAAPAGRPGSDRFRGHPHRHIAASNEGLIVGRPVRYPILRLIPGMNLRLHPRSVAPCGGSREVRATPPHPQRVFMQQRPVTSPRRTRA